MTAEQEREAFADAVWAALKADANDLRKQQRILAAFDNAIERGDHTRDKEGQGYE